MRFPVLAFLLAFLMLGAVSFASINIDNCSFLNESGETYLLTSDILDISQSGSWDDCLIVQEGNITLDCQGHIVDSSDASNGLVSSFGFEGSENLDGSLIVKNCIFSDWLTGINAQYLYDYPCLFYNNTFIDTEAGVTFYNSRNCIISNSTFENTNPETAITGLYVYGGGYLIYNNLFNGTGIFCDSSINNWNTTKQVGVRVYSNGTEIGGNYWTNGTNNGYSDICDDIDGYGFCDDIYNVSESMDCNFIDYLPYSNLYGVTTTTTTTTTTTSTTTTTVPTTTTTTSTTTTTVPTTTTTMFMTPMRQTPLGNMAVNIVIIVVALGSILYIFSIVFNPVSDPKAWLKLLITAVVLMLIVLSLISLW